MARIERIKARLLANPAEARIEDIQAVLEAYGWTLRSIAGSHHYFKNNTTGQAISIPVAGGRKVKRVYIKEVCYILGLMEE